MSHEHYRAGSESMGCTAIAPEVCLREGRNLAGDLVRFIIGHERGPDFRMPDGTHPVMRCETSIPVSPDDRWTVTGSLAGGDLTLAPSVLEPAGRWCPGQHGFVRDGAWVPA